MAKTIDYRESEYYPSFVELISEISDQCDSSTELYNKRNELTHVLLCALTDVTTDRYYYHEKEQ